MIKNLILDSAKTSTNAVQVNTEKATVYVTCTGTIQFNVMTSVDGVNYVNAATVSVNSQDNVEIGGITPYTYLKFTSNTAMETVSILF